MQTQIESHTIYTYTDSELDLANKEQYAFDICISANRLSYTIFKANRVLGYRYINTKNNILESNISDLVVLANQLEWNSNLYKSVRVFINHEVFTLVPEALFEANQADKYMQLVHKQKPNNKVLFSTINKQQAVCVFSINSDFYTAINIVFGRPTILHLSLVLIQTADMFNENDLKQHLIVNFENNFVTTLQYQNNEIKYLNTFNVDADTDTVYFILSIAEQLQLQAEKFGVYVMGDISTTSATLGLLKKYIPSVQILSRLQSIDYPISFREFQEQQHYLTTHTLLCEL